MSKHSYSLPAETFSTEIIINKSRFISTIRKIESLDELRAFYQSMQEKHPKASHNCWAAVVGTPTDSSGYGFSDDGEPTGTAGKPILKVLQYSGLGQTGLIVTRYFGGVKLGTGGLVRAYTAAAQAAVEGVKRDTFVKTVYLRCSLNYGQEATFRYLLGQFSTFSGKYNYAERITVDFRIAEDKVSALSDTLKAKLGQGLDLEMLS